MDVVEHASTQLDALVLSDPGEPQALASLPAVPDSRPMRGSLIPTSCGSVEVASHGELEGVAVVYGVDGSVWVRGDAGYVAWSDRSVAD